MRVKELLNITQGEVLKYSKGLEKEIRGFSIDSRTIKKGEVFIAIVGKEKNGHDYLEEVIKHKPSCLIVSEEVNIKTSIPIIFVSDTLISLHQIASYYRKNFDGLVIAVTGSCGKTTTKEMLSHLLETKYKVLKSEKNYNNHIGVPLTLLALTNDYDIAIIECGTNHPGELEVLGDLVKPDMVLITNIGLSHVGHFKNKRAILKEKLSIQKNMDNGVLIVNGDDSLLRRVKSKKLEVYKTYNHNSVVRLKTVYCFFDYSEINIEYMNRSYQLNLNLPGKGMVDNLLLCLECALFLNLDMDILTESVKTFESKEHRLEKFELKNNNYLIDDCYNASYESMVSLLQIIKPISKRKLIILGEMKELGIHSKRLHRKIVKLLKKIDNKEVILIGDEFESLASKYNFLWFKNSDDAIQKLKEYHLKDTVIAVKGAHSLNLKELCNYIKECF